MSQEFKPVKQVILIRKDLRNTKGEKITKGKLISQSCHSSMKVILDLMKKERNSYPLADATGDNWHLYLEDDTPLSIWLNGSFTKVCLAVNSEEELLRLYQEAKDAGLPCSLIQDNGLTEFGGVLTYTTAALGPAYSEDIDKITSNLSLFT